MRKKRLRFTVSCTSTAMPFFLSRASTDGSIRSRRAPVPSTRISARKSRLQVKCASSMKLTHNRQCFKQSSSKNQMKVRILFETVSMFIPSFVLCFVLGFFFFLPILGSTIWKSETLSSVMSLWLPTCRHGKTQMQTNLKKSDALI